MTTRYFELPLEEVYFLWLYNRIEAPTLPGYSRYHLLSALHRMEFSQYTATFVGNDENRALDGLYIRGIFLEDNFGTDAFKSEQCSVLEMLIALAIRASYMTDITSSNCLFEMLDNLGIALFRDILWTELSEEVVYEKVTTFIERTYDFNGFGGIFPISDSEIDQVDRELWYQLADYIREGGLRRGLLSDSSGSE